MSITRLHSAPQRTDTVGKYIVLATMWAPATKMAGFILPSLVGRNRRACVYKLLHLQAWRAQPLWWQIRINNHPAAWCESVRRVHAEDADARLYYELLSLLRTFQTTRALRVVFSQHEQLACSPPWATRRDLNAPSFGLFGLDVGVGSLRSTLSTCTRHTRAVRMCTWGKV